MQRALLLKRIASILEEYLPSPLLAHCLPGNIKDDTLTIYIDSPVWATKIRYLSPQLLAHLRKAPQTKGIQRIQAVVNPAIFQQITPASPAVVHRPLSSKSADLLLHAAASTDSPSLSRALRRLARHATR